VDSGQWAVNHAVDADGLRRPSAGLVVSPALQPLAGLYRHAATGRPLTLAIDKTTLRLEGGPALVPVSGTRFEVTGGGEALEFGQAGQVQVLLGNGLVDTYERVTPVKPDAAQLAGFTGLYENDEAEVALFIAVHGQDLRLLRRPDTAYQLRPLYADAFSSPLGTVRFIRNAAGTVTEMSLSQDRVWDLRLKRRPN